jgi:predicted enzyme related to lactoylglutathione lyase
MIKGSGLFLWHELMTTELASARNFYAPVGGWKIESWPGATIEYWMLMKGEQPMGGMTELPAPAVKMGAPPHWMGYIGTANLDADVKRASSLGAMVAMPAKDLPEVGRIAVLMDPQGAAFALFTPASEPPAYPPRAPTGGFSWAELSTTDLDGGLAFYSAMFGWKEKSAFDMGEAGPYKIFGTDDRDLGGMMMKPADRPGRSNWLYYVHVPSLDEALAQVKKGGGQVVNGPMEVPDGDRIAQCMDPQGALFALHEVVAAR